MQSFLVISLVNLTAAEWSDNGFRCRESLYCLKQQGLEIISYQRPEVETWTVEDCQNKCKDTNGCTNVDIQGGGEKNIMFTCTLYSSANAFDMRTTDCQRKSGWTTCLKDSAQESVKEDEKPVSDDSLSTKRWYCYDEEQCLKQPSLALNFYTGDQVKGWKVEDCEWKCKLTEKCDMIDMEFDTNKAMTSCFLYIKKIGMKDICEPNKNWWNCAYENDIMSRQNSVKEESRAADSSKEWFCFHGQQCIKDASLAIASYTGAQVKGWKAEDCERKCNQTEKCDTVDIQFEGTIGMTSCILYVKKIGMKDICEPNNDWWNCIYEYGPLSDQTPTALII